jgi:hypothetical protein
MEPDVMLIAGLGLAVLSLPALISAWVDKRPPRVGAVVLLTGLGLVAWAVTTRPGGYVLSEIPLLVYEMIARLLG